MRRLAISLAWLALLPGCKGAGPTPSEPLTWGDAEWPQAPIPQPGGEGDTASSAAACRVIRASTAAWSRRPTTDAELGEFSLLLYAEGQQLRDVDRPPLNLVFSLDSSGSMTGEEYSADPAEVEELAELMADYGVVLGNQ